MEAHNSRPPNKETPGDQAQGASTRQLPAVGAMKVEDTPEPTC